MRNVVNKSVWRKNDCSWLPLNKRAMNIWLSSLRIRAHLKVGEQENISMFSTCSELTPRAPIPDDRMEQIMQPCVYDYALLICIYEYQHSTPHKTLNCCNEFFQWSWKIRCLRFIAHSCAWPHVSSSSVSSHHRQASHTNFINRFSSHIMSCSDRPGPSTFRTFLTFSKTMTPSDGLVNASVW